MSNKQASASAGAHRSVRVNVKEVGNRIDTLLDSELQPLDAAVHDLKAKFLAGLERGYTITDLIAMAQAAGIDASDSQLRRALGRAGIRKKQTKRSVRSSSRQPSGQQDGDAVGKNDVLSGNADGNDATQATVSADAFFCADDDAENTEPDGADAMHRIHPGQEDNASDTPASVSEDKGGAQPSGNFNTASPQSTFSSGRKIAQSGTTSKGKPAENASQHDRDKNKDGALLRQDDSGDAEQNLTPEEAAELAEFDSAGNADF